MMRGLAGTCVAALLAGGLTTQATAQSRQIDDVIVDQNQIIERYRNPPEKQGSLGVTVDVEDAVTPEIVGLTVVLQAVDLTGDDLVPRSELEPIWQPYLGREIDNDAMAEITAAIESVYREADYYARAIVTKIDLGTGTIEIEVFTGYIKEIIINGEVGDLYQRLEPYTDKIAAMVPLRVSLMERYLLLISDLGGYRVNALLEQIPGEVGAGRLTLDLAPMGIGGQVTLDNLGSRETGPLQLTGVAFAGDVLGLFEQSTLVGVTNPADPSEFRLVNFGQDYPVGSDGLFAGYALTGVLVEPGGDLEAFDIEITTLTGVTSLQYPFIRRLDHNLDGTLTFNAQNTDVDVMGTPATIDRTRWITLEAAYDQDFDVLSLAASLAGSHGLSSLGATSGSRALAGRFGGEADFRLASGSLQLDADIAPGWSATFQATGQLAPDPLPDAVRFSVGDATFGRAFAGFGVAGDSGFGAAVELEHVVDFGQSWVRHSTVYGFADYGYVHNDAIGTTFCSARLGSAGAGMRAFLDHGIFVDGFVAIPTIKSSAVEDEGGRALFTLGFRF